MTDTSIAELITGLVVRLNGLSRATAAERGVPSLTYPQMRLVMFIADRQSCTVGEAASGLGISMASVSEMVDRLAEGGHLERRHDAVDRRRVLVALTPAARELATKMRAMRREQVTAALERLDPDLHEGFLRGLQALVEVMGEEVDGRRHIAEVKSA